MVAPPNRRRWRLAFALVVAALAALGLLVTSSAPAVPEMRDATAEQVTAVRALTTEARAAQRKGAPVELTLGNAELDAISAMLTQGFAPTRFDAQLDAGVLSLTGSRKLPLRWLNIRAEARGTHDGIPDFAIHIGSLPLPRWLSRWGMQLVRERLDARSDALPPIESIVQRTQIGENHLTVLVAMPQGSLLARARATGAPALDSDRVAAIYCRLARLQRTDPAPLLAQQLRRALAETEATPDGHGAALVALALFTVGPEARELAGADAAPAICTADEPHLTLQGRKDWAKHWALSAALETAAGSRISTAMGEWKELVDTKAKGPLLAPKDPSGFSFVDLASDRAGMMIARSLADPDRLAATRARLLEADDDDLLPEAALALDDSLSEAQFARRYGATDDPRFERQVTAIDALLRRGGID